MKTMCYIHCYLTETNIVMNCDADATNAFSRPLINVTLFTDSYIKTAINFSLAVLIFIVQLRFDNHNKRICYAMLCVPVFNYDIYIILYD